MPATLTPTHSFTLRPPNAEDVPQIARILVEAFNDIGDKHNFPRDFPSVEMATGMAGMVTSHPKFFGVVAQDADGQVVGSNFLDERDGYAGVGPITVSPAAQSKGVGRALMQAVIDRARATGAPGARLVQDAFNTTSMSLYTSLGFDVTEPLALMRGTPRGSAPAGAEVRPLTEADLSAAGALHERVHGFARNNTLRDCLAPFGSVGLFRGGRLRAYAAAPGFWFLNHGVGETEQDLRDVLLGAAAQLPGGAALELLVPIRRANFFRSLLAEGMRVVKPMSLMAMGAYREPTGAFFPSVIY